MNLILEFRWLRDYHGRVAADSRAPVEWPPSPWRMLCALLNAAKPASAKDIPPALRWLAALPAPEILTPPTGEELHEPKHIVPLNDIFPTEPWRDGPKSRERLAKVRADRRLPVMGDHTVRYVWKLSDPAPSAYVEALDALMAMVPYLGIGEDSGIGSASLIPEKKRFPESSRWIPNRGTGTSLPVVDESTLERLVTFHHSGKRQVARFSEITPAFIPYHCENSPDGVFLVFRFEDSRGGFVSFDPREFCEVAERVRGALLDALQTTGVTCDFLHGHHAKGRDHIQIVPIPSLGHEHADGRIRRVLLKGNPPAGEMREISMALKELSYAPLAKTGACLVPEYSKSGVLRLITEESNVWVSASPVVLPNPELRGRDGDAWRNRANLPAADLLRIQEKRKNGQKKIVSRLLLDAGHEVIDLAVQEQPFHRSIPSANAFKITTSRAKYLKHTRCHLRVVLATNLRGPLLIGPGRFFGLGLLVPARALQLEGSMGGVLA